MSNKKQKTTKEDKKYDDDKINSQNFADLKNFAFSFCTSYYAPLVQQVFDKEKVESDKFYSQMKSFPKNLFKDDIIEIFQKGFYKKTEWGSSGKLKIISDLIDENFGKEFTPRKFRVIKDFFKFLTILTENEKFYDLK